MDYFTFQDSRLHVENLPVETIAKEVGTPCYIYSYETLRRHFQVFSAAFSGLSSLICPAVKALSNLSVLNLMGRWGAGADIISGGELYRCLRASIPADRIIYAGVGKTDKEIAEALEAGILMFNIESLEEMAAINRVAGSMGRKARIALRINPDVDPHTHQAITTGKKGNKFGLEIPQALEGYRMADEMTNLEVVGIHTHIGSQITETEPFLEAAERVVELALALREQGTPIRYVNLGGGLGITYRDETPPLPAELASRLEPVLASCPVTYIFEPGRVLVGNSGILVTKVLYRKEGARNFVIVDAGMNDLIRPSFYGAYHRIVPVSKREGKPLPVDVVGPICESSDFLAKDRDLPPVESGDLLAVMSAGAYAFTMASNYNSRPRGPEILVKGDRFWVIRRRETYRDLIRGEEELPNIEEE